MKNLLYIVFLFICSTALSAQFRVTDGKGGTYFINGKQLRIQADDIPTSPATPETNLTVYKFVDFGSASAVNDTMVKADVDARWGGGVNIDGYSTRPGPNLNDSIKIVTTADGTDTIQSVWIDATSGDRGAQQNGDIFINNTDNTDDTTTVINFKVKKLYASNWVKTAGSKAGAGLGGQNRSFLGVDYNAVPSGGIYGPTCSSYSPYYQGDCGWSGRPSTESNDGTYTYLHNMWFPSSCATIAYGQHYTSGDDPTPGIWIEYNTRIILNSISTPGTGVADGVLETYRNDTLIAQKTDCVFRRYDDVYIDYIFNAVLSTYDATRTEDTYIWFDDYTLWIETDWDDAIESRTVGDVINTPQRGSDNTIPD